MAEEDKTFCGRDDRDHVDAREDVQIDLLSRKLGVSRQDILDIIEQVGGDYQKVETYIKDKQDSY